LINHTARRVDCGVSYWPSCWCFSGFVPISGNVVGRGPSMVAPYFKRLVGHIALDAGLGLQFQEFDACTGPDTAIDDVVSMDVARDHR
jgi:hypothetical protein